MPTVPGRPIPRAKAIATLSLVSSPCPPPLLLLFPESFVGKGEAVEVVAVELCGDVVAVELCRDVEVVDVTMRLSAASCADKDELEELDVLEELENVEE